MKIKIEKQITVFLSDQPGELAHAFAALAESDINITALSGNPMAADHGTVRFVVNDAERACRVLDPVTLAVRIAEVLLIEMPDRPRALLAVTECLASAGVNIEYVYGSVTDPGTPAVAVFKVSDTRKAIQALESLKA